MNIMNALKILNISFKFLLFDISNYDLSAHL